MKPKIIFSVSLLAIVLSSASLIVSIYSAKGNQAEIDRRVELALQKKEQEFVEALFPKLDKMYNGMLKGTYQTPKKKPETLKELLAPMGDILNSLT